MSDPATQPDALVRIAGALERAVTMLVPSGGAPVTFEPPRNAQFGDFASNVALVLAKQARRPPQELAGALVEDSGPVLLVVAVFALGCVLSYLWGGSRSVSPRTPAFGSSRPSAARSSGSERPSTRTSFSRVLAPRTTETLRTPTPARLAISRQRASLAFPSTGAAQTRTSSSPPRSPTIRFSLARGDSLTAISEISMRRG